MKLQARPKLQPGQEPAALPRHMAAGKVLQPAQIESESSNNSVGNKTLHLACSAGCVLVHLSWREKSKLTYTKDRERLAPCRGRPQPRGGVGLRMRLPVLALQGAMVGGKPC